MVNILNTFYENKYKFHIIQIGHGILKHQNNDKIVAFKTLIKIRLKKNIKEKVRKNLN